MMFEEASVMLVEDTHNNDVGTGRAKFPRESRVDDLDFLAEIKTCNYACVFHALSYFIADPRLTDFFSC